MEVLVRAILLEIWKEREHGFESCQRRFVRWRLEEPSRIFGLLDILANVKDLDSYLEGEGGRAGSRGRMRCGKKGEFRATIGTAKVIRSESPLMEMKSRES